MPVCRRKGVNVFDLNGNLIQHFNTLIEAQNFTGVTIGQISRLCKFNDNNHKAKDYMFSRDKDKLDKYSPSQGTNTKFLNGEQQALDAGEDNIEDNN